MKRFFYAGKMSFVVQIGILGSGLPHFAMPLIIWLGRKGVHSTFLPAIRKGILWICFVASSAMPVDVFPGFRIDVAEPVRSNAHDISVFLMEGFGPSHTVPRQCLVPVRDNACSSKLGARNYVVC